MHWYLAISLVALPSSARVGLAQSGAFSGQVMDPITAAALPQVSVFVRDDKNQVVGRALTDDRGLFVIPHAHAGIFQLSFDRAGMKPVVWAVDTVGADSVVERRYKVTFLAVPLDTVFSQSQVDEKVTVRSFGYAPRYPKRATFSGVPGRVTIRFVVDTTGKADMKTITTVRSTDAAFLRSVLESLRTMEFNPARVRGRKVRQIAEQSFEFALPRR